MDGIDKRGMIRDRMRALTGLSKRVTLFTSNSPAPSTNNVDPYATRPNGTTDTKHMIRGVFRETRNKREQEDAGNVTARKGTLQFHQIFYSRLLKAYALTVNGKPGRWRIIGVPDIEGETFGVAYLEAMD